MILQPFSTRCSARETDKMSFRRPPIPQYCDRSSTSVSGSSLHAGQNGPLAQDQLHEAFSLRIAGQAPQGRFQIGEQEPVFALRVQQPLQQSNRLRGQPAALQPPIDVIGLKTNGIDGLRHSLRKLDENRVEFRADLRRKTKDQRIARLKPSDAVSTVPSGTAAQFADFIFRQTRRSKRCENLLFAIAGKGPADRRLWLAAGDNRDGLSSGASMSKTIDSIWPQGPLARNPLLGRRVGRLRIRVGGSIRRCGRHRTPSSVCSPHAPEATRKTITGHGEAWNGQKQDHPARKDQVHRRPFGLCAKWRGLGLLQERRQNKILFRSKQHRLPQSLPHARLHSPQGVSPVEPKDIRQL